MSHSNFKSSQNRYPVEQWVGLLTPGVVVGVLLGRAMARSIQVVNQLSEDVWRGDRLPLIDLPLIDPGEIGHKPIQ
jgi:hypothetical protein